MSKRTRTNNVVVLSMSLALVANACQSDDTIVVGAATDVTTSPIEVQELGSVRLPLVTEAQATYRLVSARFEIRSRSGTRTTTLSSDDDPDATALTAELSPGQYTVRLLDGWSLQRLDGDAGVDLVRAALVSPNPAELAVRNGRQTTLSYIFSTSIGVVEFGEGGVAVRLGVADPGTLASCDVVNQFGCNFPQQCFIASEDGRTFCGTPGSLPVGAPCSSEQCVRGAQCLSLDPAAPEMAVCTALCNTQFPSFGCDCRGLSFSDQVGVCGPTPAGACDLLAQTGCADGQACQYPGGSFGVCGTPGTQLEGSSCFGEVCAAGLDCFGDDPVFGNFGTCYRFCDVKAPECSFCFGVGTGDIGRCFL